MFPALRHRLSRAVQLGKSLPENVRAVLVTLLLAAVASVGAVAFMLAINLIHGQVFVRALKTGDPLWFAGVSFVAITAASLLSGWLLVSVCPQAAGSGVPQIKAAFWKELGFVRFREVWVKFLAGVVSVGGGLSLGREGPSVFLGGGLASCLSGWMGSPKRGRRSAMIVGSAAALAAAFNTPMAAIAFALEEVIKDFGSRLLGRVMLAAVLGALVVHALIGPQPAFALPFINEPRWVVYPLACLTALLGTLAALAFQYGVMRLRPRFKAQRVLPAWLMPCVGGWITWVLGVGTFLLVGKAGVFSLGYDDMSEALQTNLALSAAALLLGAKLVATIACYATGGCGGIFSPTLFFGAMSGFVVGGLFQSWAGLQHDESILLAAVGMCACFGAAVRAPWSALLIVFEMTHSFSIIPALLLGTLISQGVTRLFGRPNFYDEILEQDGHVLHAVAPPRTLNDWQDLPLHSIATKQPVILRDLSPETIRTLLARHPYNVFPAVLDGTVATVSRGELQSALDEAREPAVQEAGIARPDQALREVSTLFFSTSAGMILLQDPETQEIVGLLTLHDILRAQTALLE